MTTFVVFPPLVALEIAAPAWRAFLAAWEAPRALRAAASDPRRLARALFGVELELPLARALEQLAQLAPLAGAEAIAGAAASLGLPLDEEAGEGPGDRAARLLAAARAGGEAGRVVARARAELSSMGPPDEALVWERVAERPRAAGAARSAGAALTAWARTRSQRAEAWVAEDAAATTLHFAVLHEARPRAMVWAAEGTGGLGEPGRVVGAPLRVDQLRVDVAAGRLQIATRSPRDVSALAEVVGEALFDDARFFGTDPAFTLATVAAMGADGLARAALPEPVVRARVISCRWNSGEANVLGAHGPSALAALESATGLAGGYLASAIFRLDLAGRAEPLDVSIRLPGQIACSSAVDEPVARAFLRAVGALAPGSLPDDLWTLAPWRHARWRWVRWLGEAEVDALLAEGVLGPVPTRVVTTEEARSLGGRWLTFAVPGERGVHYAVCDDRSFPSRSVRESERTALELHIDKLAARVQRSLRLVGPVRLREGGRVLDLGELRPMTGAPLRVYAAVRAPGGARAERALVRELVREAQPGVAALLVPRGRTVAGGLLEASFEGLIGGGLALVEALVAEAAMGERVAGWQVASEALVLDVGRQLAWLHGVELPFKDGSFALCRALGERAECVAMKELRAVISPHATSDQIVRKTRTRALEQIAGAFRAAGRPVPRDLERVILVEGRKGYRLGVSARILDGKLPG